MTTTCLECGLTQPTDEATCPACGGVCLRDTPWSPPPGPASPTPLLRSRIPWLDGAWLKVEGTSPSGSFKDRVMTTLVAESAAAGAAGAVVASSGNAAVAASSHAARHNLPLLVVVPHNVPATIERMVARRGAALLHVGDGPAEAHHAAKVISTRLGLPNLASTFAATGCEWACRGIGHELADQLGPEPQVDTVAAAVSVGPVLTGVANGLRERGVQVRMVAGQAAACAPIARAFTTGADEVEPWTEEVSTGATSIADRLTGYAREATSFLHAVRRGGGAVAAADDDEFARIRDDLGRYDGLDVEISSCAALAALRETGHVGPRTVAVLTGAGVRETLAPSSPVSTPAALTGFLDLIGNPVAHEEVESWIAESP